MLELRSNCENCNLALPPDSADAMICNFECTFCKKCVDDILENVCPNCGGGFEKRPIRPKRYLKKYPPRKDKVLKPIDMDKFKTLLKKNKGIHPNQR